MRPDKPPKPTAASLNDQGINRKPETTQAPTSDGDR
jgi:hypothetical protein